MIKSRWIRIPMKILLIWFVISIYFYFQHPVIYRCTGFNASISIGEEQLIIDEINIHNFDEDKNREYIENGKIPWRIRLLGKMPSSKWSTYVYKVLTFYSRPPLTKEYGTMQIYGTYISPKPISNTDFESLNERYDISIYPYGGRGGSRRTQEFFKNALVLSSHGKFPLKALDKPFLLTVTDKVTTKSTQLLITPQWQKKRILRIENQKSPADTAQDYIHKIYQNKPQQASKYILPERDDNSPNMSLKPALAGKNIQMEGNLKWIDVFEDYYGVYQVDAEIFEFIESGAKDSRPPDQITVYLHKNEDGNYEVIYCQLNSVKVKNRSENEPDTVTNILL